MSTAQTFRNEPIDPTTLPVLADEDFVALEPAHLRLQQAGWLVFAAVVIAVFAVLTITTPMPFWVALLVAGGVLVLSIAGIVLEQLAFTQRGWLLREHDISARYGLLSRNTTTAPFVRVQHVTVNRGALERMVGIARLSVFTAGAGTADLVIPGLASDAADQLKESILLRSAATK